MIEISDHIRFDLYFDRCRLGQCRGVGHEIDRSVRMNVVKVAFGCALDCKESDRFRKIQIARNFAGAGDSKYSTGETVVSFLNDDIIDRDRGGLVAQKCDF